MTATPVVFNDGEAYERMMGRWSRVAGEILLDWIAPQSGLRWLDVGCGNGAFTELLIEHSDPSMVVGIDPSEGTLEYARSRTDAGKVEFHKGDALELPFNKGEFDATVMALAINFVPDAEKAVAEMVRVTKSGGSVSTYMWDILNGGFTMEPFRKALGEMGIPAPIPGADVVRIENLERLWKEAGLRDVSTRTIKITLSYSDFDEFWNANTGIANSVSNAIAKLNSAEVESLTNRLQEMLPPNSEGKISHGASANAVKGVVE